MGTQFQGRDGSRCDPSPIGPMMGTGSMMGHVVTRHKGCISMRNNKQDIVLFSIFYETSPSIRLMPQDKFFVGSSETIRETLMQV